MAIKNIWKAKADGIFGVSIKVDLGYHVSSQDKFNGRKIDIKFN